MIVLNPPGPQCTVSIEVNQTPPRTQRQRATVFDRPVTCPICGHDQFKAKKYRAAGTFLQTLDLEGFAKEGLMLVCWRCTHTQHFYNPKMVRLWK